MRHVFLTMQSLLDTETYKALCVLDHAEAAMCLAMTETQGLGSVGNFGQNPPRLTCKISMNASRIYKTQTDKTPEHIGKLRPLPYICNLHSLGFDLVLHVGQKAAGQSLVTNRSCLM